MTDQTPDTSTDSISAFDMAAALATISDLAVAGHPDIAKRMLDLVDPPRVHYPAGHRGYRTSAHSTPLLDEALAKARGIARNASLNKQNTHLRSKYADLGSVFDAARGALDDSHVAVTQPSWASKDGLMITTRLAFKGEWMESDFPVGHGDPNNKQTNNMQARGVALTYARRQAFCTSLCIAAGDDNDGDPGRGKQGQGQPQPQNKWQQAINAFSGLDKRIDARVLLAHIERASASEVTDSDHGKLGELWRGLKSGIIIVVDGDEGVELHTTNT
jgi:hypothetical protein